MKILLVNPPIYDFTAYDYWLRPLGLLRVAGMLDKRCCELRLFDFLDRAISSARNDSHRGKPDKWARGHYAATEIPKPEPLADIPRKFQRFGRPKDEFIQFLKTENKKFDAAFIQVSMTWWYLGAVEIIEVLRQYSPETKIVIGGPYAMLAAEHAKTIGADYICESTNPANVFNSVGLNYSNSDKPARWDLYDDCLHGIIKLSDGCPFKCTYCGVSQMYEDFSFRPMESVINEFQTQLNRGAINIAFYDDALLHKSGDGLFNFINRIKTETSQKILNGINFHTPNALNARFIDTETAEKLIAANFRTFYIGMESFSTNFQKQTGSKVFADEFAHAVNNLLAAGADKNSITAYMVLGHPDCDLQDIEATATMANSLGVRVMASDFSPVPGTPDGDACKKFTDISEPLNHNKTAFTIRRLGLERSNELKIFIKKSNRRLSQ